MFERRCAIAGIGHTEYSKASGRSELRLAVEAVGAALADAGLEAAEVNGMSTVTFESNPEIEVARALGIPELTFFSRTAFGGGAACATVMQACLALAAGLAKHVVVYRALNMRSGARAGSRAQAVSGRTTAEDVERSWHLPFGLRTPAAMAALFARRYMHEFGADSEDFGRISVAARRHAATNPGAWFYQRPITLEDHQSSRWIVEPLRLLDCCQESDGAVAVVLTTLERARELRRPPVVIDAAAQGSAFDQREMTSYYRREVATLPEMELVARQLYGRSGLSPAEIQTAIVYDHFTPYVLPQLEAFGFCGRGEARDFVRDGKIELGGRLPVNPHGGQLGEAYMHGMNGLVEAVRQIRGTAPNQIDGVEHVLVTAGAGVPTSGVIVGRDRG
jgi:acetyl-CoA acetyltransferase